MKTNRNRIEISGYLHPDKKVAEAKAVEIIAERNKKITEAKKEWLEALSSVKEIESNLKVKVKRIAELDGQLMNLPPEEKENSKIPEDILALDKDIDPLKRELANAQKLAEAARLIKVKKIRKLNIKAYQLKPVKCIGKRGSNWIFVSE